MIVMNGEINNCTGPMVSLGFLAVLTVVNISAIYLQMEVEWGFSIATFDCQRVTVIVGGIYTPTLCFLIQE